MSRGMEPFVIGVVLTGIIIFLFVVAGPVIYERGKEYFQSGTCQDSIERAVQLGLAAELFANKIRCPTEDWQFGDTEKEVNAQIADALKTCWARWHEGRIALFSKSGVFCDVCARFTSADNYQVYDSPAAYLASDSIGGQSTLNYIRSIRVADGVPAFTNQDTLPDDIDTGGSYAVVFRYARGGEAFVLDEEIERPSIAEEWTAEIGLIQHSALKLQNLGCQYYPASQR